MTDSKIPVTVIIGSLGSGKTTLLQHLLKTHHNFKILIVQNEFSEEMGIESPTFLGADGSLITDVYELPNGCLCCSVRDNLVSTLESVLQTRSGWFTHILVESSGVADPERIVNIFWTDEGLEGKTYLDAVITMVDTLNFLRKCRGGSLEEDRLTETPIEKSSKTCVTSQDVKQILYANAILLNKCDMFPESERREKINQARCLVQGINPLATIHECEYADVQLVDIFDLRAFDSEKIEMASVSAPNLALLSTYAINLNNYLVTLQSTLFLSTREPLPDDSRLLAKTVCRSLLDHLVRSEKPLWTVAEANMCFGELLWNTEFGTVYRSKGLFLCEAPEGPRFFMVQSVNELFEISEIHQLHSCVIKLIQLRSIVVEGNKLLITSKFLFIGDLKKDKVRKHLNKSFEKQRQE